MHLIQTAQKLAAEWHFDLSISFSGLDEMKVYFIFLKLAIKNYIWGLGIIDRHLHHMSLGAV